MERHTVGVQTRFDERDSEVTLDVIRRRLCRLITGCDTGSDEMNIEVQLSSKSLVLPTEVCNMLPVNSRQTSYLPKHPVTNIDVKDATTYAVAMWHNSSNAISNSIGEVYVVDIESRIPAVSMRCLGGISKLAFGTDESSLLFGGSLCGAIHVWDTSIHLEVANIPPSISNGHIDPIVYMKLLDSDNLLSVDATGRAMTWSLRNLSEPVSRIEWEIPDYSCRISAVCHGTSFYCTSLSGRIYICNLGEIPSEPQVIHDAGITSSASSTIGPIELIATSSLDCTVKIWDCQNLTTPLYDLMPSLDCTVDMAWSPTLPEVLATVDNHGNISVWNLSTNREMPVCTTNIDENTASIAWTTDGTHLIVGGDGVNIFEPQREALEQDPDYRFSALTTTSTTSFWYPMSSTLEWQ